MGEWSTLDALWRLREDRTLSHADWRVAIALVMFADDSGACWPSVGRLAATARTNKPGVRRSLRRIETGAGPIAVAVERGRGSGHGDPDTHRYQLSLREGWVQGDPTPVHADPTPVQADPGVGTEQTRGGSTEIRGVGPGRSPKRTSEEDTEGDTEESGQSLHSAPLALTPPSPAKTGPRKAAAPKPRRWTRVPEGWQPNDQHRGLARELGVNLTAEVPKFTDHEFRQPKTDADAAFRTWLRNAAQYSPPGGRSAGPSADWPSDADLSLRERIRAGEFGPRLKAKLEAGQLDAELAKRLIREARNERAEAAGRHAERPAAPRRPEGAPRGEPAPTGQLGELLRGIGRAMP